MHHVIRRQGVFSKEKREERIEEEKEKSNEWKIKSSAQIDVISVGFGFKN